MSEPFIGQIQMFGFNFAPRDWAFCNGELIDISQNPALFSLLGTMFGGDGRINFALPDLRGRTVLHKGSGPGLTPRIIGQRGGTETETLSIGQTPNHTHAATLNARNEVASLPKPENNLLAVATNIYSAGAADANMSSQALTVGNTGSGQSHENMAPYQVINYCIALAGVFPSRN